ncbi:MAG: YfhO family protein, partial [Actinomycetota bacterium]
VLTCTKACAPDHFTSTSAHDGERSAEVVADAQAIVSVNEQYDDGWTVTVDGHDAKVIAVDGAWAGVAVTAGHHHIEWSYDPPWLVPSLVIMVCGWLGLAALAWRPRPPESESRTSDESDATATTT